MPSVCTLCRRPDKGEINAALVAGAESLRLMAKRFGTSPATLTRHREHLPRELATVAAERHEAQATTLLEKVAGLEEDAHRLRAAAEEGGDLRAAIACIRVLADLVQLWQKIREEERSAVSGPLRIETLIAEAYALVRAERPAGQRIDARSPAPGGGSEEGRGDEA